MTKTPDTNKAKDADPGLDQAEEANPRMKRGDEAVEDADAADITELTEVEVRIRRDEHATMQVKVFDYEVPILQMIHGSDSVIELDQDGETVKVADWTPEGEMDRLKRKYWTMNKGMPDPVAAVYGNQPAQLAQAAGVSYSPGSRKKGAAKGPKQSSQEDNRKKGGVRGA